MQHDHLERDPSIGRRLQGLPDEPQPYGFAEFRRRIRSRSGGSRWPSRPTRVFRPAIAVAASLALALAVLGLSLLGQLPGPAEVAQEMPPDRSLAVDPAAAQTEAMEGWLATLPAEPAVVRVGSHAAVASLEDRIALLDDVLSAERAADAQPARLLAIEQQRGQLLRSLVQVRYAEGLAEESR
jgi:hypothetical protein